MVIGKTKEINRMINKNPIGIKKRITQIQILLLIDKLEPNNLGIGSIETKTTINKVIIDKYIPIKPKLLNH